MQTDFDTPAGRREFYLSQQVELLKLILVELKQINQS